MILPLIVMEIISLAFTRPRYSASMWKTGHFRKAKTDYTISDHLAFWVLSCHALPLITAGDL